MRRKRFDTLVRLLRGRARSMGVRVRALRTSHFRKVGDGIVGYYSHSERAIRIDRTLPRREFLYILAHEIGHAWDHGRSPEHRRRIDEAVTAFHSYMRAGADFPLSLVTFLLARENDASLFGERLLRELGHDDPEFEVMRELNESAYLELLSPLKKEKK